MTRNNEWERAIDVLMGVHKDIWKYHGSTHGSTTVGAWYATLPECLLMIRPTFLFDDLFVLMYITNVYKTFPIK